MSSAQDSFDTSKIRVVIVCHKSNEFAVRRVLGRLCRCDWEAQGEVKIIVIPHNTREITPRIARWVNLFAPPKRFAQVFVEKGIAFEPEDASGIDFRHVIRFPSPVVLEKRLPEILAPLGLDWLGGVTKALQGHWLHGGYLDREHIESWIKQFERLGYRWVGEGLLRSLDFWSAERQRLSFGLSDGILSTYDTLCVNRHRVGKSGDFLANILKKQVSSLLPSFPAIRDFREFLTDASERDPCASILLIEDGLFTGTEATNFLSGLLGIRHPLGRDWSTAPLPEPKKLREAKVTLKFAITTALGIELAQEFLNRHGLGNIAITPNTGDAHIDNLTPAGIDAVREGRFFALDKHKIPTDPGSHLVRPCFSSTFIWKDKAQAKTASDFCAEVGLQLFRQYLAWRRWLWEEERVKCCGLGMYGMGFAVGFGHSVPKASLPLLWMDGRVRFGRTELTWKSLFPNGKV